MEQTNTDEDWLKKEAKQTEQNKFDGEMLPSLQLEDGKITEFEVDFTKPFQKWEDTANDTTKKIIPVTHEGIKKNFWLNVRNPLYNQLIKAGSEGKTKFKVMRTGMQNQTRYSLVKE